MSKETESRQEYERNKFLGCCMLWFFLSGVEYSIVLPTVHHYLGSIGAEANYIGFVISALSFGALVSAPVYAKITDHYKRAIYIVRIGMLFSIMGSFLYFLVPHKNVIVLARFIGGIGWGLEGALMGQIGRTYNQQNKTSRFAAVLMMRQFGVVIGPISVFTLKHLQFTVDLGDWTLTVTKYSAAGLVLACAWLLAWIVILLVYIDPVPEGKEYTPVSSNNLTSVTNSFLQIPEKADSCPEKEQKKYRYTKNTGIIHEPIIVASFCTFSTYCLQSGMETLVTPFTDYYLGWTIRQNATMFAIVGSVALTGYLSMQFVSKKLHDRDTLLLGCLSLTVVLVTVIAVYPNLTFRARWIYPIFGVGLLIFCWFLPYVVVSAAGILSKSASNELQSTVQTVRTTGEVLAQVMSPAWVSNMLHHQNYVLVFQLAFMSICSVLTILSWKVLKPEEAIHYHGRDDSEGDYIVKSNGIEMDYGLDENENDKNHSKRFFEDVAMSHTTVPSSVMCSLASIK